MAKQLVATEPLTEKEKQKFLDAIFTNTIQLLIAAFKFNDALAGIKYSIEQAKYFGLEDSKEIPGRIKTVEKLLKLAFDDKLKQILKQMNGLKK